MRARILLAAAALCSFLAACKSSTSGELPPPPTGGGGRGGGTVIFDAAPSGVVIIMIDVPMKGTIQSTNAPIDVEAEISIQGGSDVIDPSSVEVALTPQNGTATASMGKLVGPAGANTYRGQVSVAGLASGPYSLAVSAASTKGVTNQASVDIEIDSGPTIVVVSPVPQGHYKNGLNVQLIADPGAFPPLQSLQASVGGMPLNLQKDTMVANEYKAVLDFNAPMPPLSGNQLFDVSASNSDGSPGTRTEVKLIFVVDNAGPAITATTPPPGAVVGGVVDISARISDDAGLNESSLQVLIGDSVNPQFKLPLINRGDGSFGVLFDTRNLTVCKPPPDTGLCIVLPTLSFRAADQLGNDTVLTYGIAVDNVPPVADLQPPNIRDTKVDGTLVCSHEFNPLRLYTGSPGQVPPPLDSLAPGFSGDAPIDLCRVPQAFDLRARIQDDGNHATGLKNPPISLVDPNATAAYVLDDPSQGPLVVDTDGDGFCDHINPNFVPTTEPISSPRQVLKVRLSPVPIVGAVDFTPDLSMNFDLSALFGLPPLSVFGLPADATWPSAVCTRGKDTNVPLIPCLSEQPTIAIGYAGGQPAIWSVDPIDNLFHCLGGQFDTHANNIADAGWKCLAVATADLNGNASVSQPLRIWVDYNYPTTPWPNTNGNWCLPPPSNAGPAPLCTGTYNMSTGQATTAPCRTRNFQSQSGRIEDIYLKSGFICFGDDPTCPPQ